MILEISQEFESILPKNTYPLLCPGGLISTQRVWRAYGSQAHDLDFSL